MASTNEIIHVTNREWEDFVRNHRHIWANPRLRCAMRYLYPFALPLVETARMIGMIK